MSKSSKATTGQQCKTETVHDIGRESQKRSKKHLYSKGKTTSFGEVFGEEKPVYIDNELEKEID